MIKNAWILIFILSLLLLSFNTGCKNEADNNPSNISSQTDDDDDNLSDDDVVDDDMDDDTDDDDTDDDDDDDNLDDDDNIDGPYDYSGLTFELIDTLTNFDKFDFSLDSQNRAGACILANQTYYLRERINGTFSLEAIGPGNALDCALIFDENDNPIIMYGIRRVGPGDDLYIAESDVSGNWSYWKHPDESIQARVNVGGIYEQKPYFVVHGNERFVLVKENGIWETYDILGDEREIGDYSDNCASIQGAYVLPANNLPGTEYDRLYFTKTSDLNSWQTEFVYESLYLAVSTAFASDPNCQPFFTTIHLAELASDDDDDDDNVELDMKGANSVTLNFSFLQNGNWKTTELYYHVGTASDVLADGQNNVYIAYTPWLEGSPSTYEIKMAFGVPPFLQEQTVYSTSDEPVMQLEMLPGTDNKIRMLVVIKNDTSYKLGYLRQPSK